jgi:hypothetical protein
MTGSPEDAPFDLIRAHQTHGINYDVTTDDVVSRLQDWQTRCKFEVIDVKSDALALRFLTLPDDLDAFARDVYAFCPDVIDQGFGCYDEMLEAMDESGAEVPEEIHTLAEGLDPEDPNFGLELLKRSLARDKELHLWWD